MFQRKGYLGMYLRREGVLWVAVCSVEVHCIAALEALQMWVLKQVSSKSHISAVNIGFPTAEFE